MEVEVLRNTISCLALVEYFNTKYLLTSHHERRINPSLTEMYLLSKLSSISPNIIDYIYPNLLFITREFCIHFQFIVFVLNVNRTFTV